jgi:ABC-type nitrate/sulfonate/bicarbonate transport system permease component
MKLNLKAIALTAGILWALVILTTGIANLLWPGYGEAFLKIFASLYPGYKAERSIVDVMVGSLYALVDGIFCGLIFGWVYNLFVGKERR